MTKLALVTGATGGIGSTLIHRLIHDGFVVIGMARNREKLAQLHDTCQLGMFRPCTFDVTNAQDLWGARIHDLVQEYGTPDLLVCAHGAAPAVMPTVSLPGATFYDVFFTDVWGTFMACQTVGTHMAMQRRGNIIVISSLHAKQTYPQRTAYSIAKSGLSGLVRSLAIEWGPYNVRTNAILPWQCSGARTNAFLEAAKAEGYDLEEAYKQRSPTRRLIEPSEVADAVLFLAQNESMNGCELIMDGGISSSMWYKGFTESMPS